MDASEQLIIHLSICYSFSYDSGLNARPAFYNSLNGKEGSTARQRQSGTELHGPLLESWPKEIGSFCRSRWSIAQGRGHGDPRGLSHVEVETAQRKNDLQTILQARKERGKRAEIVSRTAATNRGRNVAGTAGERTQQE